MFYTSYFGNKKNFPQGALICGICRYPPDEKTGDFCHRHILRNWLIKNNIIKEIKEL